MPDRIAYSTGPDTEAVIAAATAATDRRAHDARRETTAAALDAAPRSWTPDPRNRRADPDTERVRAALAAARVVPLALGIACRQHGAAAGVHCWPTPPSVCGPRLADARAARPEAPDPERLPGYVWRRQHRR